MLKPDDQTQYQTPTHHCFIWLTIQQQIAARDILIGGAFLKHVFCAQLCNYDCFVQTGKMIFKWNKRKTSSSKPIYQNLPEKLRFFPQNLPTISITWLEEPTGFASNHFSDSTGLGRSSQFPLPPGLAPVHSAALGAQSQEGGAEVAAPRTAVEGESKWPGRLGQFFEVEIETLQQLVGVSTVVLFYLSWMRWCQNSRVLLGNFWTQFIRTA